jgi:hypothetical protein
LIEHIVAELPNDGIRHLKRLLQIYHELLVKEFATVTLPSVKEKLNQWTQINSLKKHAELILKCIEV